MFFKERVPVKYDIDVMVAGGGPAGIAAAISASRQGRTVYLAEGQSCFGGMGTAGMLPMFCPFTDGINFLSAGIGEEVVENCLKFGATGPDGLRDLQEKLWTYITIKPEPLKRIYDNMILESGIEFSLQTMVIGVDKKDEDNVNMVFCSAKSGIFAVKAKIFIDCTGDGDLAVEAGASYEKGDDEGNMMAGSLCSIWAGIDWKGEPVKKWDDGRFINQAIKDGIISIDDPGLPGMYCIGETTGAGNIGHCFGVDGTDEVSLTKAFIEQRQRLLEYSNYYKKYLKGYSKLELVATASMFGTRETRRIIGDYALTINDFINRGIFNDEIGRYAYQVDLHPIKPGMNAHLNCQQDTKGLKYQKGESYGIPYRSLVPKGLSNVLVAGRCISCDRYMLGSVRVMPACFITGQAAGIAAAIAVENNNDTRGFEIIQLQERLEKSGGYLPNYNNEVGGVK